MAYVMHGLVIHSVRCFATLILRHSRAALCGLKQGLCSDSGRFNEVSHLDGTARAPQGSIYK